MPEQPVSIRQSAEQKRAAHAAEDVKQIAAKSDEKLKNSYRDLARKTAANIQLSGLGQSLAFLRAKAGLEHKGEHWWLYQHISRWVMKQLQQPDRESDSLLEWIVTQDSNTYRRATTEALAYLGWLKRFAEALLPEK